MIKTKKSFTLIEMLISITLFSIIVIFLYQALHVTKTSNKFYSNKLKQLESKSNIKKLMFLDIINSKQNSIHISSDKNDNTILTLETTNLYHNNFFVNVTYLLSRDNKLMRIESKDRFKKDNTYQLEDNSYIDILENNISKFVVTIDKKYKKDYIIYLLNISKENTIFTLKSIR